MWSVKRLPADRHNVIVIKVDTQQAFAGGHIWNNLIELLVKAEIACLGGEVVAIPTRYFVVIILWCTIKASILKLKLK